MALLVMAAPLVDEKGLVLPLVEVVITPKSWPLGPSPVVSSIVQRRPPEQPPGSRSCWPGWQR
jgi:hypothetical protein